MHLLSRATLVWGAGPGGPEHKARKACSQPACTNASAGYQPHHFLTHTQTGNDLFAEMAKRQINEKDGKLICCSLVSINLSGVHKAIPSVVRLNYNTTLLLSAVMMMEQASIRAQKYRSALMPIFRIGKKTLTIGNCIAGLDLAFPKDRLAKSRLGRTFSARPSPNTGRSVRFDLYCPQRPLRISHEHSRRKSPKLWKQKPD